MVHRLSWLDSCRALAALLVIVMHVTEIWVPYLPEADTFGRQLAEALTHFNVGAYGVYVFFLVSGFVIPFSVKGEGIAAAKDFLIRRLFRLMPLYWFSIPLAIVTTHWLWHRDFGWAALMANIIMVPNLFELPFAEGLYWSLQVEVVFYLMVSVFVARYAFARTSVLLPFVLVLLTIKALKYTGWQDVAFYPVAMLVLNMLKIIFIGWLIQRVHVSPKLRLADGLLLAYIVIEYFLHKPWSAYQHAMAGEAWLNDLSVTLAIVLLLVCQAINLNNRVLAYLGKISYSLYLLHPVVMYSLLYVVATDANSVFRTWPLAATLSLVVIITIACSHLTWRFIEAPAQRFAKRLTQPVTSGSVIPT